MKLFLRITAFWTAVMMLFPALRKAQEKPKECEHDYALTIVTELTDVYTSYFEGEAPFLLDLEAELKCTKCGNTLPTEAITCDTETIERGTETLTLKSGEYETEIAIKVAPKYRIAFVGDSITEGSPQTAQYQFTTYVTKNLKKNVQVTNCGVGGISVTGYGGIWHDPDWRYIKQDVYNRCVEADPEIVLIMLGSNDSTEWDKAEASFESEYVILLESLMKDLPDAEIIVVTPPIAEENKLGIKEYNIVNSIIPTEKKLAEKYGLTVFDMHEFLENREGKTAGLYFDGIHLNPAGAKEFGEIFTNFLCEYKGIEK